jgi:hypothetical protein
MTAGQAAAYLDLAFSKLRKKEWLPSQDPRDATLLVTVGYIKPGRIGRVGRSKQSVTSKSVPFCSLHKVAGHSDAECYAQRRTAEKDKKTQGSK